jgi:hypothetical protein
VTAEFRPARERSEDKTTEEETHQVNRPRRSERRVEEGRLLTTSMTRRGSQGAQCTAYEESACGGMKQRAGGVTKVDSIKNDEIDQPDTRYKEKIEIWRASRNDKSTLGRLCSSMRSESDAGP